MLIYEALHDILDLIGEKDGVPSDKIWSISYNWLEFLFNLQEFPHRVIADGTIYYTTLDMMKKIVEAYRAIAPPYKNEVFDCDNFSISLVGFVNRVYGLNNVASIMGCMEDKDGNCYGHALNLVLVLNEQNWLLELYVVEPQTGEFFKWGEPIGDRTFKPDVIIWV